jgi:N-acetylneuraminic acid mutarotase
MTIEEYDPAVDTWTERAPCPTDPAVNSNYGNLHIAGASANGKLYLVVGNLNTAGGAATYEYDPVANTWATKAAPPFGMDQYAVSELNGQIYALASQSYAANPDATSKLAQYDPSSNVWTVRAPLPSVWWARVVSAAGKLYAVGGVAVNGGYAPPSVRPTSVLASVSQYDPVANQWSSLGQLGTSRHSAAAVAVGADLYVTGGSSSTNEFAPAPVTAVEVATAPVR